MKRFIVDQVGFVKLEADRRFLMEVPDDCTEEEVQELIEEAQDSLPESEGLEWMGEGQKWSGYEIEVEYTDVSDPETVAGGEAESLKVIRLDC